MTVFIDATVIVAALTGGSHHESCRRLLFEVAAGQIAATSSTRMIEDVWLMECGPMRSLPPGSAADAFEIFPEIISIDEWIMQSAFTLAAAHLGDAEVGPTHLIHAATCRAYRLDSIVSADAAFDRFGWLRRLEPDGAGVEELSIESPRSARRGQLAADQVASQALSSLADMS